MADDGVVPDRHTRARGPLAGVSVVELAMWVAGPAAGAILAEWGADVIKVEPPGGDPYRGALNHVGIEIEPPGPLFDLDNRGKRSAMLDLRNDADRATFDALVARADVLVTNIRPGALERLGLAPEALVARFPRLIVGSITGFGWSGPDRDRPGHATGAFWARSGLAASMVPDGEMPPPLPPGTGGHEAALALVAGILAKLHERQTTNRGGVVEVSLFRSGVYALGSDLAARQRYGHEPSTAPRTECETPLVNVYRAAGGDRFWLLCLEGDRHWQGLAASIGRPELVADGRFADAADRFTHRRELIAVLDAAFAEHPLEVLADRFDRNGVWWEPVVDPNDVADDPQAQTGFVGGSVATPVDFDGSAPRPGPVPAVGEHTAGIRAELD
ncbi:MAG: CoA transferase [Actinomycetota bacterium]